MNRTSRLLSITTIALGLMSGALAATPQPCSGPRAGSAMMPPPPGQGPGPGPMSAMHLARLKDTLAITPAQEGVWKDFADQAAQQAQAMQQRRDDARALALPATAPERLARHLEQLQRQQAQLQAMQAPLKALYDALSPEQRVRFDAMGPGRGGPRRR